MSDEKRLGANPLDWVAPERPADAADSPFTRAERPAPRAPQGTLFSAPDTIQEEDLMGKDKIKIKQTLDTAQVVAHLEDLAQSLSAGVVRAENGGDSVVLVAAETMKFEMKLSRKKDKAKCAIEMEWEDDGSGAADFKISG
jgi:amphi-Trp domain-containing protein